MLKVNFVEIAPPYAGTLFGVTNTLANVSGFVAPYIVGVLLQEKVGSIRYFPSIFLLSILVSEVIY